MLNTGKIKGIMKELLFSVSKKDCEFTYTKGTGKGGQKRNKTSSAVYCKHLDSKAQGYAEDSRQQIQNKRLAFKRMLKSKKFKAWHKIEVSKRLGIYEEVENKVDKEMKNILVEGKNDQGQWEVIGNNGIKG